MLSSTSVRNYPNGSSIHSRVLQSFFSDTHLSPASLLETRVFRLLNRKSARWPGLLNCESILLRSERAYCGGRMFYRVLGLPNCAIFAHSFWRLGSASLTSLFWLCVRVWFQATEYQRSRFWHVARRVCQLESITLELVCCSQVFCNCSTY